MLAEYLETLDGGKEVIQEFKLDNVPEYRHLFRRVSWHKSWFDEINIILIELGRLGCDKDIKIIHDFIKNQIQKLFIIDFNKVFKCKIWNHFAVLKSRMKDSHWKYLSTNPAAFYMLKGNMNNVDGDQLSANQAAIKLFESGQNKISWSFLSFNPAAIHLIEANLNKVNCEWLSRNPNAIHILEKNLDKINWDDLTSNKGAISLIRKYTHKIHINYLSSNEYDYLQEKIDHFNSLKWFPKSRFIIKNKSEM